MADSFRLAAAFALVLAVVAINVAVWPAYRACIEREGVLKANTVCTIRAFQSLGGLVR